MADENTVGSRLALRPEEPEVKTVRIPLPPQLKADEEQLREAEHAAEAVGQAVLLQQARKGANRPAPSTRVVPPLLETVIAAAKQKKNASPQKCTACQTPIAPENAEFSFCTHCGADLPKASLSLETAPLAKPQRLALPPEEFLAHGVRDPRATVRKIAQVHAGVGQAQQTGTVATKAVTSPQIEIEFRREINPTVHAILAFLFPGVGQLLNGQVGKGILLILAAFVAVSLLKLQPFGLELLIARVLVGLDAYRIGEKRRNGQKVGEGDWDVA